MDSRVPVGARPPGAGDRFFDGLLDDVRILQRALSAVEIQAIVSGDPQNQPPTGDSPARTTLLSIINGLLLN